MNPLVSIVLPTYNGEKYLSASIQSCLTQTYKNIQLIIVDDCSTDTTPEIIRHFQESDPRIVSIRNKKNIKLPQSLNVGFEAAGGDYFTWTSDDNYYDSGAIKAMMKELQRTGAGLVYSDYTLVDDKGMIKGTRSFRDINDSLVRWEGCGACFLYKADLHEQLNGYNPSAFLIEDYDFFLRAYTLTVFAYIRCPSLYFYRIHSGSLTSLYGYYNFDLQKIVQERMLPSLFSVCSRSDRILFLRKFAIYYGVSKNNAERMKYYLFELAAINRGQAFLAVLYISYRKFVTGVIITIKAWYFLARALTRKKI